MIRYIVFVLEFGGIAVFSATILLLRYQKLENDKKIKLITDMENE